VDKAKQHSGYKCGNPLGEKQPRFGGCEGVVYQKVKKILSDFKALGSYYNIL